MNYRFEVLEIENNELSVKVEIYQQEKECYNGIFLVKYVDGMVLLDLTFIRSEIKNDLIRREFISKLKAFVKKYMSKT